MSVGLISSSTRPRPRCERGRATFPWFLPPASASCPPNPGRNLVDRRRECHLYEHLSKVFERALNFTPLTRLRRDCAGVGAPTSGRSWPVRRRWPQAIELPYIFGRHG